MNERPKPELTLAQKRMVLLQRQHGQDDNTHGPRHTKIPILPADATAPASFAQQRLWFLDKLAPGNPFYTVSLGIPLEGPISTDLLEQSLSEIALRHSALRTSFAEHDGAPIQIVHSNPIFPMERIDLSHLPRGKAEATLASLTAEEARRSFDLTQQPLALARLIKLAPRRHHLLLTLHHIVCDGWSLKVLGRELTSIYTALAEGKPHQLPDLPVQYRDFASWQRQRLTGAVMDGHRAYWRKQLANALELALPTDFQRPAVPTYGGAFVPFALDHDCADLIRALCTRDGVTPFMVLLTAWMVLLGRHAAMDDILVAAPSAGRDRRELEQIIGFFVNTMVLRGDISGDPTFRAAVDRVRGTCLEAFSHDEFPFDQLIEDLAPKRRGDRNPLAQVVFQLFSAPDRSVGQTAPEDRQRGTSKFDLRLDLWDTSTGYSGELEYSTDLFEHGTATLMCEQFQVLLQELVARPDQPISQANTMSQGEYQWLLENTNKTDRPFPDTADLPTCFAKAAAQFAQSPAITHGDVTLSYRALDRASDGAASTLAAAGVRTGDHVAILLPRSPDLIVAILGILKVGAVYVPVDTDTPVARILGAIKAVSVTALISDADHLATLGPLDIPVVQPDTIGWQSGPAWSVPKRAHDDVANIMFTSGSTGTPKAVLVPHQGIVRIAIGQSFWTLAPDDTIAQASNCAFDASTVEIWSALLNGCHLAIIDRNDLLSPGHMRQQIAAGKIDHLFVTTALFHRLVEEAPAMFGPLKTLITGGSRLEIESVRRVLDHKKPGQFLNAYGPTEATAFGTIWAIDAFDAPLTNVPIGTPVNNTTAYILDKLGRLVPRAQPGELFLGGQGIALGYLGDPQQTARKFGPSPFRDGERLYATGDRVRLRHDGTIDFLGRFDDQVKIRGFRVEPEEIAAALQSHPSVASAQVLVQTTPESEGHADQSVLAFYTPTHDDDAQPETRATANDAVAYWQKIYDDVVYQDVGTKNAAGGQFDITGWTDSATGQLLTDAVMTEQVKQTCDRIIALGGQEILEFGCGTGLIVFPLAPQVKRIHGIDISERALTHIRQTAQEAGLTNITLDHGSTEALAKIADNSFDTVVLNSTVQYFPSEDYLLTLIADLIRVTRPEGAIFLGDIRHLGVLQAFQTEIALDRAEDATPASAVQQSVLRKLEEEQELLVNPNWFTDLPTRFRDIGNVSVQLKRGAGDNELARFRYDVTLHLGTHTPARSCRNMTWGVDVAAIGDLLAHAAKPDQPDIWVRGIPNLRTEQAQKSADLLQDAAPGATVKDIRTILQFATPQAFSPEDFCKEIEAEGHYAQLGWGDDPACFDLVISESAPVVGRPLAGQPPTAGAPLTSNPALGRSLRALEAELAIYLEKLLPDYMLPQSYVRLAAMPLTPNGKVDKRALAATQVSGHRSPGRAPQTPLEIALTRIFCAVLQIPQVNLDDDFFRLGGHSLKATRVISRITSELGVTIPLRAIFENGTVAGLALAVLAADSKDHSAQKSIAPIAEELDIDAMDNDALERTLALLDDTAEDDRS